MSARTRLPGETTVKRNLDGYEGDTLTPEQISAANVERFVAAKIMAAHLTAGANIETSQRELLHKFKNETGVEVPEEDTPEYFAFLSKYNKGQMTEDEIRVRNAIIDLGQTSLSNMLAQQRALQNQEDDQAFAAAHLDVLRTQAETEMKTLFVEQNTWAQSDNVHTILTTRGLGPCIGITIYDPMTKKGWMGHYANTSGKYNAEDMFVAAAKETTDPSGLKIWLRGGQGNKARDEEELKKFGFTFSYDAANKAEVESILANTGLSSAQIDRQYDLRDIEEGSTSMYLDTDLGIFIAEELPLSAKSGVSARVDDAASTYRPVA